MVIVSLSITNNSPISSFRRYSMNKFSPVNLKPAFTFVTPRPAIHFEEWKPIVYDSVTPDMYYISSFGRLKNNKDQILKAQKINSGYYTARLFKDKDHRHLTKNRYKQVTVQRLVATTFLDKPPLENMTVNHKDGDKSNNCVWNLEWSTQLENNIHSYKTGLNKNYGNNCYCSKFTEEQVRTICEILQSGDYKNYREILGRIGMECTPNNQDMVGNIKRRIAWKWISCNYTW